MLKFPESAIRKSRIEVLHGGHVACQEQYNTVEPRFNEVAGDRPNLFVKWRVRYIEVLFHTFYCNFGRDIEIISFVISRTSLNRGSLNRGSTNAKHFYCSCHATWPPCKTSVALYKLFMDSSLTNQKRDVLLRI